ncbi:M23 family metallopeptidase [Streptomyces sp. NPDC126499]|uniref:M23 family metallopeptidase n=1 Tax=Streptomyces sp. NPDC126499 TaxID=3155314 RepID=UPI0033165DA9
MVETTGLEIPGFTDVIPDGGCGCVGCAAAGAAARAEHGGGQAGLRGVRRAVVAAVGAVALAGTAAGPASAEPAPSHAGWDGSRYWFRNETGQWRWTSHHATYVQRTGAARGRPASSPARRTGEPVFRGHQGWDARDRVYWYRSGGHWYWTSHRATYERRTGAKARGSGGADTSGTSKGGTSKSGTSKIGTSKGGTSKGGTSKSGGTRAGSGAVPMTRGWTAPVSSYVFTGFYGQRGTWSKGYHTGQDFAVPSGTTVRAAGPGRVVRAGYGGSYGYEVVIRHGDGRYTQYAHLSRIDVSVGQSVPAGRRIALSGATGRVTGPHLHFEVRTTPYFGSDVDPLAYLRGHGVRV